MEELGLFEKVRDKSSETIVSGFKCHKCHKEKVLYSDVSMALPEAPECCGHKLNLRWRDKVVTHTKVYPLGI